MLWPTLISAPESPGKSFLCDNKINLGLLLIGHLRQIDTIHIIQLKLNAILDRARLEDFSVTNENRSLPDVAQEMLVKAGWISI